MNMSRTEALNQIITFGEFRNSAFSQLLQFGFNTEIEHFKVTKSMLADVLNKYLSDVISADDLDEWANFIECRDDIDYSLIEGYVYALANPELMGDISKHKILKMLQMLNSPSL